ncbi:Crp/Fnr family transcriptional regulator [Chryseobacterium balustinum]|uniref:DNA-binding transcriptional activator YeiL n=2 Tax=Chryseobacterium balustinum TaxID=246 RepID=A0AAX2IL85_9FLAO|nr:cAMP-binding domain of CRP or a regulatory subunit of cAMP-dependent protein kinases [Chryseobacterium balustinum]SQA90179.1 DNA-binding transcriptional activator YeiL [Chryseobacterium balustinum]
MINYLCAALILIDIHIIMEDKYILLRKHIEKVVHLSDEEFASVSKYFIYERFKKNEIIISEGEKVVNVFFVLSGLLRLFYTDEDNKQHIISFAMEDWWETDFQAFYTKGFATLTLESLEETDVLSLSLDNFEKLCNDLQKMERFFLRKSIAGHIGSEKRILSFLTLGARERYEYLLMQHPSLLQRLPKSLLASYLGVSRETLSRLFS